MPELTEKINLFNPAQDLLCIYQMEALTITAAPNKSLKRIAQFGFIAKGTVYLLLGLLALLITLHTGNNSGEDADKTGVFRMVKDNFGGTWLLFLLGLGLVSYSAWRMVEAYQHISSKGKKRWQGLRYFFSGIVYLSVAVSAFRVALQSGQGGGDNQQDLASELLAKPFGQWLLGVAALIIAGVGVYQIYYALSEKYKKHVQKLNLHNNASRLLLGSGKLGYSARGIVWLIIAFLSIKAAINARSKDAGDTSRAVEVLQSASYGSYLLAALALGLMAYGIFNFIRARYEDFNQSLR